MKISQLTANRTWFISDPHFGHANIIPKCRTKFRNLDEMHQEMITKWNSVVGENHTVFVVGDFAWTPEAAAEIRPQLNGHIRLIAGNHDHLKAFSASGLFQNVVYWYEFPWCGLTAHHIPLHPTMMRCGKAQVHGHIHNNPIRLGPRYMNVSTEVLDYTPISALKVYEWARSVNASMQSNV